MKEKTKKLLIQSLPVILISLLTMAVLIYAWQEPSQSPPQGNVFAPINVGDTPQFKSGALGVGGIIYGYSNAFFDGNVGIGTTRPPNQKLDVAGKIKISDDNATPTAGTIRWTGTDFEGYNGSEWKSLTAQGGWSGVPELRQGPAGCGFVVTTSPKCYTLACDTCGGGGCTSQYLWCNGVCGAGSIQICDTSPLSSLLYNGQHTVDDCTSAGGQVVEVEGVKICRFQRSTCPLSGTSYSISEWTQYKDWSETSAKTCNGTNSGGCTSSTSCTTGQHSWSNNNVESCVYKNSFSFQVGCTKCCWRWSGGVCSVCVSCLPWQTPDCDCSSSCSTSESTCYANVTQIGCY